MATSSDGGGGRGEEIRDIKYDNLYSSLRQEIKLTISSEDYSDSALMSGNSQNYL